MAFGHYLLVNVVFHYYMAVKLGPGHPDPLGADQRRGGRMSAVCKKCLMPKPQRAHHCSVCDRCVLKMDHHCPWLNNCVGHANHKHFFLYMAFTLSGCLFVMVFGLVIAWDELLGLESDERGLLLPWLENYVSTSSLIWFEIIFTVGTFFILSGLSFWHAKLITRGETSVEAHINRSESARAAKEGRVYVNPYDFGPRRNWLLLMTAEDGRSWPREVLWPSTTSARGDGFSWETATLSELN